VRLDPANVVAYLQSRGAVDLPPDAAAAALDGGVSNDVLAVGPVVVKQALAELRVADHWAAKRERVVTEGRALRLAGRLAPGSVPDVLDIDAEAGTITIARAPDGWRNWKAELMAGRVDPAVAARLGHVLARWHQATLDDPEVAGEFNDVEAFVQLRVDPYHRTVAQRVPEAADAVNALADRMLATSRCLVHGDFSPKNVLTGDGRAWVLDWEVAHTGDPAFDVGFLTTHLILKAVHGPANEAAYRACLDAFLAAYEAGMGLNAIGGPGHLIAHVGCLLLARAAGKSPAEYLNDDERAAVRARGVSVLLDPPADVGALWANAARGGSAG
jgi:5-methylthioribose kinase